MRELRNAGRCVERFIKHGDYRKAVHNVVLALGLNRIQAELWLDTVTGSLLQYYTTGIGHPTSEAGYQAIQAFTGPHAYTMIKAHAVRCGTSTSVEVF